MSVILGVLLAVLFGAANAYLGLRVGMTVSASIPAAVISMGIIRILLKRDSILENNMVQTIGSAGESLAAGAIFTLPALFMWAAESDEVSVSFAELTMIAVCGGVLGVLFMVPLRKALIVKEHGTLPYPEGTACAKVLAAGETKGKESLLVFQGLGISAAYKFVADGLKLFPSRVDYTIPKYRGAGIGVDALPALAGVGYICGANIGARMLAGGIVSWLVLMPLISLYGGMDILHPATTAVETLDAWEIWRSYIRYIGAGAVATGGFISLLRSMPLIFRTFRDAVKGIAAGRKAEEETERDLPMWLVGVGILGVILLIWLFPAIPVNLFGAVLIAVLGFFFAAVSARMVGMVGSSNNPVSGMAIGTLLLAALLLKAMGNTGSAGMVSAIAIGSVICIVTCMAGDTSQDLKTGYLVGATPRKQQIGEFIGVLASALAIGGVLYLLNQAWGYGSEELPAPQATLMRMVVEGVMENNLPWHLVFAGAGIAVAVELTGVLSLPFAVGLYLPIHLSVAIMAGGFLRYITDKRAGRTEGSNAGILYSSGLIAGEGLTGILLAAAALIPLQNGSLGEWLDCSEVINLGNLGGLAAFLLLLLTLYRCAKKE
ncbi:MAG: OPT family oligopeptide transporter [Lachnospiraceae bacterium]